MRLFIVDFGDSANRREIARHYREGLFETILALSQQMHRSVVRGIAGQMKTADALHGNDCSLREQGTGSFNRGGARKIFKSHIGAADWAGIGLSMKTAIGWVVILGFAGKAHGERGHGGCRLSYGRLRMMVKRGPQLVQLIKG